LREHVALGEPDVEEEEAGRDDDDGARRDQVIADTARRLVDAGVAAGRVVRTRGRCDDGEQREQERAEADDAERAARAQAGQTGRRRPLDRALL
jgi:hypothetical protein